MDARGRGRSLSRYLQAMICFHGAGTGRVGLVGEPFDWLHRSGASPPSFLPLVLVAAAGFARSIRGLLEAPACFCLFFAILEGRNRPKANHAGHPVGNDFDVFFGCSDAVLTRRRHASYCLDPPP